MFVGLFTLIFNYGGWVFYRECHGTFLFIIVAVDYLRPIQNNKVQQTERCYIHQKVYAVKVLQL